MGEYRLLQAKAAEDAAPHDGARCLKTPCRCKRKSFNAVLLRAWRLAVPRRCEHEDRRCCTLASILQKPPFRCQSKTDKAPAASPEHAQRGVSVKSLPNSGPFSIFSSQRVHASSGAKADSRPAGFGSGTVPLGGFAFDPNECCIPTGLGSNCSFCSTSWRADRQGRR